MIYKVRDGVSPLLTLDGFTSTTAIVNGKPVSVSVNAFIKP